MLPLADVLASWPFDGPFMLDALAHWRSKVIDYLHKGLDEVSLEGDETRRLELF
jgi:hypothetical protein